MNPSWDADILSIIMLVQHTDSKLVLQAVKATPAFEATVTLDCEPDGLQATWHLVGPYGEQSGSGDAVLRLFDAGAYSVVWEPSPYWTGPAGAQAQTIPLDGSATFEGHYSNGPLTAVTTGGLAAAGQSRGGTLVDVDHDGDLDIHVVRYGEADLLLRNDGAMGFVDIAAGAIADAGAGTGAAWADLNGDRHLDVFLTRADQENLLLRGDGLGGFVPMASIGADLVGPAEGANWVDHNRDGKMDLYVFQNNTASTTNLLLQNRGYIGGTIALFEAQSGPLSGIGNTSTCAWTDANLDGRLDPYVVKRFGANQLFQNMTIGYNDKSGTSGLTDTGNDAAAAWGDFDNDGDFDLYLANDGSTDKLYRCTGPFTYELVTGPGLGDTGHARGVAWADLDNDTHLDLYVPRYNEPDLILMGDGTGAFTRVMAGVSETEAGSAGVAAGDLDGDGRVDIFVPRTGLPNVVLKNGMAAANHWFKLRLIGAGNNTAAIGARVVVTVGGVSQSRLVTCGGNSPATLEQHFGLGAATVVDRIDIYWPRGLHQVVTPKPADIALQVIEGQAPFVSAVDGAVPAAVTILDAARPNPFNPSTTISFTLATPDRATLAVYTVDGRLVRMLLDGSLGAGTHSAAWDGTGGDGRPVASGTYLCRLRTTGGFDQSARMTLVK
jgi:hypothetical protein